MLYLVHVVTRTRLSLSDKSPSSVAVASLHRIAVQVGDFSILSCHSASKMLGRHTLEQDLMVKSTCSNHVSSLKRRKMTKG